MWRAIRSKRSRGVSETPRRSYQRPRPSALHPLALGYRCLGGVARLLPRGAAYAASRRMMDAVYLSWPRGRRAAQSTAAAILPHADWDGGAESLARAQFRRYGEYLVDAVRIDEFDAQGCFEAIDGGSPLYADTWEQLREWYQRRPILFAVIHFGNWDVLGGAFSHAVGPSLVLADDLGHQALNHTIQSQRARLGMTPVHGRQRGSAPPSTTSRPTVPPPSSTTAPSTPANAPSTRSCSDSPSACRPRWAAWPPPPTPR